MITLVDAFEYFIFFVPSATDHYISFLFMIVFRSKNDNIVLYDFANAFEITNEIKIKFLFF